MSLSLQKLFGVTGLKDLLATITPSVEAARNSQDAVAALQSCLKSGTAVLVGSVAADLHLPKSDLDIVVTLAEFSLQTHAATLQSIAATLKSSSGQQQGYSQVNLGKFSVQCRWKDLNLDILVGSSGTPSPLDFLDPRLTAHEREALSASTAVATTAFLAQQPCLFKTAVRVAKHWVKVVHGKDWDDKLRNRPKSYLLVLLVLKAYQQYMAAAAATAGSMSQDNATADASSAQGGYGSSCSSPMSTHSLTHDQAAVVEHIMVKLLRLAAGLSSSTLLFWEVHFSSEVVQQMLARPDWATVLRPKGCELHPLVLDLANPTNNVAAAVPAIDRLRQLAAADLCSVEGDAIMQLQQQLREFNIQLCGTRNQLQKMEDRLDTEVVYAAETRGALVVHQQILCRKPICNWSFEFPATDWLPDSKSKHIAGPQIIDKVSGLSLEFFSQPLEYNSDQPWAGISFKFAATGAYKLQKLVDLLLPVPIKICSSSKVTLSLTSSTQGYGYYRDTTFKKDTDDKGILQGSSSYFFWLGRAALARMQLLDSYNVTRQQDLQYMKQRTQGYVLKFDLHVQLG